MKRILQFHKHECELALENLLDAVIIYSSDTSVLYCSEEAQQLFGLTENQMTGKISKDPVWNFTDENSQSLGIKHYPPNQVLDSRNKLKNYVIGIWSSDKTQLTWCSVDAIPIFNGNEIEKIVVNFENITERKQAEKELLLRKSYLGAIIENQPGLVWLKDLKSNFLIVNQVFANSCGIADPDFLIGKNDFDIWPEELARKYQEDDLEVIKSNRSRIIEEPIFDQGELKWFETYKKPVYDESGLIIGTTGWSRDISDRKMAEQKIREKDRQLRKLSANVPDLIYQFTRRPDGSYYVPLASEGIKNIFGCTPEEVANDFAAIANVLHPGDKDRIIAEIEYSAKHLTYFTSEFRVQVPGREMKWIYSRSTPEKLPDGGVTWYGFNMNITQLKQTEDALRESEERYRNLIDISPDAIIIHCEGIIVFVNQATCDLVGAKSPNDLIGKSAIEFVHPDDREVALRRIKEMMTTGKAAPLVEEKMIKLDGSHIFVEVAAVSTLYKGKPSSQVVLRDTTIRRRSEEALLESKQIIEGIINAIPASVFWKNKDLVYLGCNALFAKDAGYSDPKEIIGKNDFQLIWHDQAEMYRADDFEVIKSGCAKLNIEEPQSTPEGTIITLLTNKIPLQNSSGEVTGVLGTYINITDRKNAETELLIAKEKAEESDRLKTAFLANMSHEIRTPMNGILGFAELLKEPGLSGEQQQEYIQIIEKGGARMLNIINDIVDISKIESKLMKVSISETNINQQIQFIYSFFKQEVEQKGIKFSFKNGLPDHKSFIQSDTEKIYAILTNLVKNAIKFTREGFIEFGYRDKGEYLEFYVKDSGIGIRNDRQQAIFERFVQADVDDKSAFQGAGLGLSISKAYVEMLGGKIWLTSNVGSGTTFYFTIAAENKTSQDLPVHAEEPVKKGFIKRKLKILIVEDDETADEYLSIVLNECCREILHASNGKEAIEICLENTDIDLVLMDVKMPLMGGYEATREIRKFNKDLIIIAQTAYALSGDREIAISSGCNDYITKPLNKNTLLETIGKYF